MAITYPIPFPSIRGAARIQWRAIRADKLTGSPSSFVQQVIKHQGQRWEADIVLPPMDRSEAEQFLTFLLKLDGRFGTFTLSPPEAKAPRGTAKANAGTPLVAGANQTGATLTVDGLPISETGYLLAGDYIQTGSNSTTTLHKVLSDVDTDATGAATIDIWPALRVAPADNSPVTVSNAKGLFRLEKPEMDWSVDEAAVFGISFGAVEAING